MLAAIAVKYKPACVVHFVLSSGMVTQACVRQAEHALQ